MHFTVLYDNLKATLAAVLPCSGKSSMPILESICIVAGDRLTLTATNLETTIIAHCGAKVATPGAACVPAKLLSELLAGLPNDRIECALDTKSLTLTLCVGHYQTTIKCLDAEDFPAIPSVTARAELPLQSIRDAEEQVAVTAGTSNSRPVLQGVHMVLNGIARYEAADGYRMAQLEQALEGSIDPAIDVVVPAKALSAAARAFKGLDDNQLPIRIGASAHNGDTFGSYDQLLFDAGDIQVITRLIDGHYPDLSRSVPSGYLCRVVTEVRELVQVLKVASVYAARSNRIVKLQVTPPTGEMGIGKLTLSANAAEVGDSVITVDAMVQGDAVQIALNADYMAEALSCIDTPQVAIELQTAQNPAIFKPVGTDGYLHLVMPMTVR